MSSTALVVRDMGQDALNVGRTVRDIAIAGEQGLMSIQADMKVVSDVITTISDLAKTVGDAAKVGEAGFNYVRDMFKHDKPHYKYNARIEKKREEGEDVYMGNKPVKRERSYSAYRPPQKIRLAHSSTFRTYGSGRRRYYKPVYLRKKRFRRRFRRRRW